MTYSSLTWMLLLGLFWAQSTLSLSSSGHHRPVADNGINCVTSNAQMMPTSRRKTLSMIGSVSSVTMLLPTESQAATPEDDVVTLEGLTKSLRSVPTFCIVGSDGSAYMLYKPGDTGYARGFAFTTFPGALAVLGDAQRAAEKGGYSDIWKGATITTIPADIAVRLALQPRDRSNQRNDQKYTSIIGVIPGIDERDAALKLDDKYKKDGSKVPLFYFDNYKLDNGSTPLYFNPQALVDDWKARQQSDSDQIPPRIRVIDLVALTQYVLKGRSNELPFRGNLVFVPTKETMEMAKKIREDGAVPYQMDRMII